MNSICSADAGLFALARGFRILCSPNPQQIQSAEIARFPDQPDWGASILNPMRSRLRRRLIPSLARPPTPAKSNHLLVRRPAGALSRIEIRFQNTAKVGTREKGAMRTGKDVPNHGFGALGLRDARIELAKFGFGEPGPWAAPPIPGCEQGADFSKREPRFLAEPDQGHALGARRIVVSASSRSRGGSQQSDALVVAECRAGQAAAPRQLTNRHETEWVRHKIPLT